MSERGVTAPLPPPSTSTPRAVSGRMRMLACSIIASSVCLHIHISCVCVCACVCVYVSLRRGREMGGEWGEMWLVWRLCS